MDRSSLLTLPQRIIEKVLRQLDSRDTAGIQFKIHPRVFLRAGLDRNKVLKLEFFSKSPERLAFLRENLPVLKRSLETKLPTYQIVLHLHAS